MARKAWAVGCAGSRRVLVLLSESLKLWPASRLPCEEGETLDPSQFLAAFPAHVQKRVGGRHPRLVSQLQEAGQHRAPLAFGSSIFRKLLRPRAAFWCAGGKLGEGHWGSQNLYKVTSAYISVATLLQGELRDVTTWLCSVMLRI
ncbi:unnamed protein product [Rangifer tarandus platyrhynchus]|uniref:Uncharacterized protein n=2 Tax=Rangifer tarandus platyrhynchus TaxID=3082113 RepID=A0ACB0FHL2_RANTA|nr:unnamed protein product [Rangifer tarandus platyrhynchus]CAI9712625.1 unnamed protein product [Rangifer tarandus platyrhynchus]